MSDIYSCFFCRAVCYPGGAVTFLLFVGNPVLTSYGTSQVFLTSLLLLLHGFAQDSLTEYNRWATSPRSAFTDVFTLTVEDI